MAQQAARKIKRTGGAFLLRGLLWSIGATVAAVAVFAVIIGLTDVSDGVIRVNIKAPANTDSGIERFVGKWTGEQTVYPSASWEHF